VLARSLRQKCLIHRCRNVLAKVPATAHDEIRDAYWVIFDTDALNAAGARPGHQLVTAAQARIDAFARTYGTLYPSAVKCLLTDRETRRRVKVIGRLPGETSCLNLVWAVLDRASRGWRGVTTTNTGLRLLHDLRRQLLDPPTPIRPASHPAAEPAETVGAVA
jgi:transposase-like protein